MRIARSMSAPSSLPTASSPWTVIIAPLEDLLSLAGQYDAWLMSDDAHGIGVLGGGRGSSFSENSHIAVPLQMGTLSKAIGSYGGYLCASAPVIELMRNRARTLIYSTGLPPASVAAAIAALDLIEREPAYAALPVAKGEGIHAPRWTSRSAKPDRPDCHRRRRDGAVPLHALWKTKAFSSSRSARRRCQPVPHACVSHLQRNTRTMRSRGSPISFVTDCRLSRGRLFRHLDRHRYRQDLRDRRAHSLFARVQPARGGAQACRERL